MDGPTQPLVPPAGALTRWLIRAGGVAVDWSHVLFVGSPANGTSPQAIHAQSR